MLCEEHKWLGRKAHWGKEDLSLSVAKISPNPKCLWYFHLQSSLHLSFFVRTYFESERELHRLIPNWTNPHWLFSCTVFFRMSHWCTLTFLVACNFILFQSCCVKGQFNSWKNNWILSSAFAMFIFLKFHPFCLSFFEKSAFKNTFSVASFFCSISLLYFIWFPECSALWLPLYIRVCVYIYIDLFLITGIQLTSL